MDPKTDLITGSRKDLPGISDLSEAVYGYRLAEDHLDWRYFQNPVAPSPLTLVKERESQRIVGCYGVLPVRFQSGETTVLGAQAVDTMVHPDYQGKGLFTKMGRHCYEVMEKQGYKLLYGFPNKAAYPGRVHRLNWVHTGNVPALFRPLAYGSGAMLKSIDRMTHCLSRKERNDIRLEAPDSTILEAFLHQQPSQESRCEIVRSAAWLHWRYDSRNIRHFSDHSPRHYEWCCLYDGNGTLQGFLVWGVLDSGPDATLCELQATCSKDADLLLQTAIDHALKEKLRLFRCYVQNNHIAAHMRRNLFIPIPRKLYSLPFVIRDLCEHPLPGNLHHHHPNWQLMGGDIDTQ